MQRISIIVIPALVWAISLVSPAPSRASIVTSDFVVPDSSIPHAGTDSVHTDYIVSTRLSMNASIDDVPYGVPPSVLHQIYNVGYDGDGAIAIVDAYDYKNALADFDAYSKVAGLPEETSANVAKSTNKVFQVVYASGAEPAQNADWNGEEALDIEIAHAMAPKAKIYLVEAASSMGNALYKAVLIAAGLPGVREVSMSWGGAEAAGEEASDASIFGVKGVVYLASSGDSGAGTQYPASSPNVIAVGGTTLHFLNGAFVSETGWNGSGGGRSIDERRPAYQVGVQNVTEGTRGVPDIAADADPDSGIGVILNNEWWIYGGTSLAAPLCAGIINDAHSATTSSVAELYKIYAHKQSSSFRDITVGSNGYPCRYGYDLVTGVGSPNGTSAF